MVNCVRRGYIYREGVSIPSYLLIERDKVLGSLKSFFLPVLEPFFAATSRLIGRSNLDLSEVMLRQPFDHPYGIYPQEF